MTRIRSRTVALGLPFLATLVGAAPSEPVEPTAAPARAEVLVLGVYHMANPGHDLYNTEADDVLSPARQAEIAELIAVLRRFRPTKIAVEAGATDRRVAERYAAYLAGEHPLSRNETEQIGFRLAAELGHPAIHPVDADGEFPYPRLLKYVQATGREPEFEALQDEVRRAVEAQSAYLASHTILETLRFMNSAEQVALQVGFYYRQAAIGEPWDWAGADLVADWTRRNLRIYTNIARLIDSPAERILVVYGAGHLGWLQQALGGNPEIRLRRLDELLE